MNGPNKVTAGDLVIWPIPSGGMSTTAFSGIIP